MKYEVVYTIQKEVRVLIDVKDKYLNAEFKKLGKIESDKDFKDNQDPRWSIEQIAYDEFSSGGTPDSVQYDDNETIVNRSINRVT